MKTAEQILQEIRLYIVAECGKAITLSIEMEEGIIKKDPLAIRTAKIRLQALNDILQIIIPPSTESTHEAAN